MKSVIQRCNFFWFGVHHIVHFEINLANVEKQTPQSEQLIEYSKSVFQIFNLKSKPKKK